MRWDLLMEMNSSINEECRGNTTCENEVIAALDAQSRRQRAAMRLPGGYSTELGRPERRPVLDG